MATNSKSGGLYGMAKRKIASSPKPKNPFRTFGKTPMKQAVGEVIGAYKAGKAARDEKKRIKKSPTYRKGDDINRGA